MGRRQIWIDTCDPCEHAELSDVEAVETHVITKDDGPAKEYGFCQHCVRRYQDFFEMLTLGGREIKPVPPKEPKKPSTPKKVQTQEQPALPSAPEETGKKQAPPKEKQFVRCPLPHPTQGGGPLLVAVTGRPQHAKSSHQRMKAWEIRWEDPYGILEYPCITHEACLKTNYSLPSKLSINGHNKSCPLPRIDMEASDEHV